MAEKHVNYFALEKACEKPGCPVCTIITERSNRYIDNMLFEHVSDRGFRARYRDAGGFCREHSRMLESYRDGLAVAILGADVLRHALPELKRSKAPRYRQVCVACEETSRIEREFLGFIGETADEHFVSFFTASEGLCVPHYSLMLTFVKKMPKWLRDFQETKFERLLNRTTQFIECSAWGRQDDFAALPGEDKVVWKEITLALRGNRE